MRSDPILRGVRKTARGGQARAKDRARGASAGERPRAAESGARGGRWRTRGNGPTSCLDRTRRRAPARGAELSHARSFEAACLGRAGFRGGLPRPGPRRAYNGVGAARPPTHTNDNRSPATRWVGSRCRAPGTPGCSPRPLPTCPLPPVGRSRCPPNRAGTRFHRRRPTPNRHRRWNRHTGTLPPRRCPDRGGANRLLERRWGRNDRGGRGTPPEGSCPSVTATSRAGGPRGARGGGGASGENSPKVRPPPAR
jgi:hypothetical protein